MGENDQHAGIMKNVVSALNEGKELLAPGYEGIRGLTISNAIHYSAWTGKKVELKNFPHDEFYELLQEKIRNSTVVKKGAQKTADTEGTY